MFLRHIASGVLAAAIVAFAVPVQAVTMDMVPVGDAGNAADDTTHGEVDYAYSIGTYEVTAGQYAEFLNAVAKTDTYALWNTRMGFFSQFGPGGDISPHIVRSGSSGSYVYTVTSGFENLPMIAGDWYNWARFCNWLTNDKPTGAEGNGTTETGSYTMNGLYLDTLADRAASVNIVREATAVYVLPTVDEWYKAAYYDPNKAGGAGYWDYPTKSETKPSNDLPDAGNNANFQDGPNYVASSYTTTYPYRTVGGTFATSEGPNGTYDQAGNVREWLEDLSSTEGSTTRLWYDQCYYEDGATTADWMVSSHNAQGNQPDFHGVQIGTRIVSLASEPVDVVWTGTANTTWSNTGNWNPGSTPDGVNVTFDDSATGTVADIASAATPTSVTFNASQNFSITGASFGIGGDATVLKQGTGTVTMSSANSYTGLTTVENGKLVLAGGAKTPVLSNAGVDVKFGKLVLDYTDSGTSPTAVDTAMKASYAGGAWAGGQFQSTTATTANTLGWKADTVNKLITVEYTLYGDANVDGSVNLSDLGFLGDNYGATSGATWAMGDFNYDGKVNLSDLGFLGDQYGGHVAGFVTAGPANPAPEPGTLVLLAMASVGLGFYGARVRKKRQVRLSRLRSWCLHRCFFPPGRGRSGFGRSALIAYPQSLLRSQRSQEYVILKTLESCLPKPRGLGQSPSDQLSYHPRIPSKTQI